MSRIHNLRKLGTNNPWHLGDNSHPEVESKDTKTLLDRTLRRMILPILTTVLQTTSSSSIITFILSVSRDCGIIRHVVKPEWRHRTTFMTTILGNKSQTMTEWHGKTWQIPQDVLRKFYVMMSQTAGDGGTWMMTMSSLYRSWWLRNLADRL